MVREALSGYWTLLDGLTGGTAGRARGLAAGLLRTGTGRLGFARTDELARLQSRVRDLERDIAELRAATDAGAYAADPAGAARPRPHRPTPPHAPRSTRSGS